MAELSVDLWLSAPARRNLAIAASVVVHVLVFLALFWKFGSVPTYAEPPVINVQLTPWTQTLRRRPPPPKTATPPRAPTTTGPVPPTVLARPAVAADANPVPQAPAPADPGAAGLRNALRGLTGCDHADMLSLSPAEREACLNRMAKGAEAGRQGLNLDMRGAYAKNPIPYLNRKPHNGCKVGAGGDTAPSGDRGTAGGVKCAWSF